MALAFLMREGSQVRVVAPYNADFVAELKQIPYYAKTWLGEQKHWLIEDEYGDLLFEIASRYFSVQWVITEHEAQQRVSAAMASAQRLAGSGSHSTAQCLDVVKKVYREEAALHLLPPVTSENVLRAVYRALAREHHPDVAGAASHGTMVAINAAYDLLLKRVSVKSS